MVEMFFILDHKCHCCCAIRNHKSRLTPWTKRKGLYFSSEMFVISSISFIYEIKNIFSLNPKLSITYKFLILFSVFRIHTSYVKKCIGFFFHQTSVSMNCGGYDVFLAPRWCKLCPRSAPSIPSKLLQFYFDGNNGETQL